MVAGSGAGLVQRTCRSVCAHSHSLYSEEPNVQAEACQVVFKVGGTGGQKPCGLRRVNCLGHGRGLSNLSSAEEGIN